MLIRAGEQALIVDCGTGLLPLQGEFMKEGGFRGADIFITHIHWDHIQGIAFFTPFFCPDYRFAVYGEPRHGKDVREQIYGIMNSPMFPVEADSFNADMSYNNIHAKQSFTVGDVAVDTIRLRHPNICTGYRFTYEGKSICIVADYEHSVGDTDVAAFAKGCGLLVYDAQYDDEAYEKSKVGWGHSTWQKGLAFAAAVGAGKVMLTHHDPMSTDAYLDNLQEKISREAPNAFLAMEGVTLEVV